MKRWGNRGKRWEQETWLPVIRTPLCRNPTACLWTEHWAKQKHAFEERRKGGEKITQHGWSEVLCSYRVPWQTKQWNTVCFWFLLSTSIHQLPSLLGFSSSLAWFALSTLVLLLFPFAFPSWCEMNIKVVLGQLGGLQQNIIGLHGPQQAGAAILASLATIIHGGLVWPAGWNPTKGKG